MYSLDIFKESNIDYSWSTILVGRELELLMPEDVMRYAVEYLMLNPECCDTDVAVLAYGVPASEVDTCLQKALKSIGYLVPAKGSPVWNLEKRKWRYCILTQLKKEFKDLPSFFRAFEMVYADFGYPSDMRDFLQVLEEGGARTEKYQGCFTVITQREFDAFLEHEKLKIEENAGD